MISNNIIKLNESKTKLQKNALVITNNKTKLNNPKSVNNENIKIGNTISQSFESKLKISILQFIRKMSKITMKVGGFLNNCASVCVWHLFPLLSSLEVRSFYFYFYFIYLYYNFILFCFVSVLFIFIST